MSKLRFLRGYRSKEKGERKPGSWEAEKLGNWEVGKLRRWEALARRLIAHS